MTTETRLLEGTEIRATREGKERAFEGLLVPYGKWASIGGLFEERHVRGVFTKSIKEAASALPLMAIHDRLSYPIGKAVEWDDRDDGLHGRWVMADTKEAKKAWGLIEDRFLCGLSCGFQPVKGGDVWENRQPPNLPRVTRRQARLVEASVVPVPTWNEAVITHTRSARGTVSATPNLDRWSRWFEELKS